MSGGQQIIPASNGQRIYVDPKTRTIIVQLANDSRQDFPFRKIAAYLSGTTWEYPRSIPALVRQAGVTFGADSIRPVAARLIAERNAAPERYVITRNAMLTVGTLMTEDPKTLAAGVELLKLDTELYPDWPDTPCATRARARAAGLRK